MNKFVIMIKINLLTLSVIFLMLIARIFVFPVYSIDGASMDYTLQHNEKVMGIKMFDVERFDIVIVQVPEANKRYVKRVIGLPGDKIEYKNDQLFINGEFIEEAFLSEKKKEWDLFTDDFTVEKVPNGEYFIMGDNRRNSIDSRHIGTVSRNQVISKVILIYWPLDKIKILNE